MALGYLPRPGQDVVASAGGVRYRTFRMDWNLLQSPTAASPAKRTPTLPPGWTAQAFDSPQIEIPTSPYRAIHRRPKRGLALTRSWRRPFFTLFLFLYFAVFLTIFSLSLAFTNTPLTIGGHASSGRPATRAERSTTTILTGLLAIGFTYTVALLVFNKSKITVRPGSGVVVTHGPLPSWRKKVSIALSDLRCLEITKRTVKGGAVHDIVALLRDGRRVVIASGMDREDHAEQVKNRLARRLTHTPERTARARISVDDHANTGAGLEEGEPGELLSVEEPATPVRSPRRRQASER